MAHIILTLNPFEPYKVQKHEARSGSSVWQWLKEHQPGFEEFDTPTICVLNGTPILRQRWNEPLRDDDVVNFIAVPGEPTTIWLVVAIVIAIAAVAVTLLMPIPSTAGLVPNAGEQPSSDPVFTTKGQSNSIRLGEPIEVCYGRNRIYPSYASRPYFQYINNDQFQHALFCLGHGGFEVDEVRIGDTEISNFAEVEYEIVPPGAKVVLFPTNVYTAPEVSNQTLFGSNEDEYPVNGWVGPFVANAASTDAKEIQIDLLFPKGLYNMRNDGHLLERTADVEVQVREIDDVGDPVDSAGTWYSLNADKRVEIYISTKTMLVEWRPSWAAYAALPSAEQLAIAAAYPFTFLSIYASWSWEVVGVNVVDLETGDPAAGTVTTEYDDSYTDDDPTDREGTLKTITAIFEPVSFTVAGTTNSPLRRTFSAPVTAGRYEVRCRRVNETDLSTRSGNDVVWGGLRSYLTDDPDFGLVTLLAVKIRATNNLNAQTQQAFNVIATRKLPIYESGGGMTSTTQTTRSIVWAFVDLFRSTYGGRMADTYFDWDALLDLDATFASRGDNFDWIFRDKITVWEAARVIARTGRAVPVLAGTLLKMIRDEDASVPVTVFTPDNMIQGSFRYDVKLWDLDEYNGVQVEYTDSSTGYKQEQVLCLLPEDTGDVGTPGDNPKDLRLEGVQSRTQAYHEGMYALACQRYLRENITFETGLEGHIPIYGDLIGVAFDLPEWGQSGYVIHAEAAVAPDWNLWVSQPIEFQSGQVYQIQLRGSKGEVLGPYAVEETSDPRRILVTIPSPPDFLLGGDTEPMLFVLGVSNSITKLGKVVRVEPLGDEAIRITAVNDAPIVHTFDVLSAPALGTPNVPPATPDLPEVENLVLSIYDGTNRIIRASWDAAFGSEKYIVQMSQGDTAYGPSVTDWVVVAVTDKTNVLFQTHTGLVVVRVAAINRGQGLWTDRRPSLPDWHHWIHVALIAGLDLSEDIEDNTQWVAQWFPVPTNIYGYRVSIYGKAEGDADWAPDFVVKYVTPAELAYTSVEAVADNMKYRYFMLQIAEVLDEDQNVTGDALNPDLSFFEFSNSVPSRPQNLVTAEETSIGDTVRYVLSWDPAVENDLVNYKVWVSPTFLFDPTTTAPYIDEVVAAGAGNMPTSVIVEIPIETDGGHGEWYWRVGFFDVWGDEIRWATAPVNISMQATIPAYVP